MSEEQELSACLRCRRFLSVFISLFARCDHSLVTMGITDPTPTEDCSIKTQSPLGRGGELLRMNKTRMNTIRMDSPPI